MRQIHNLRNLTRYSHAEESSKTVLQTAKDGKEISLDWDGFWNVERNPVWPTKWCMIINVTHFRNLPNDPRDCRWSTFTAWDDPQDCRLSTFRDSQLLGRPPAGDCRLSNVTFTCTAWERFSGFTIQYRTLNLYNLWVQSTGSQITGADD